MATYKISFLAPRKASSLESKRTTQTTMFQPLYRKNSKTRRENVELPTTIPLKSYRKATLTETRNKSTYLTTKAAKGTSTS
jgi:recombination DNA repair RAD52 pathway protein